MAGLLEYTKNGQVTEPPLYRFMRGNVQSFLNSIPDPSKMTPEQQLSLGANINPIMGLLGMTAYHGSPAIFDKFDLNKVGTGTGAQAYGHGVYLAESPRLAENYSKMLVGNLTKLKSDKELTGNMYKVDIPDEYIPKMLDWDKPLKEQNKEVQSALAKIEPNFYSKKSPEYNPTELGSDIYKQISRKKLNEVWENKKNELLKKGLTNNPELEAHLQTNPEAGVFGSNVLNEYGIKGIKYLDKSSPEMGGQTNNFVVFDPSNVKILERNNKGLLK